MHKRILCLIVVIVMLFLNACSFSDLWELAQEKEGVQFEDLVETIPDEESGNEQGYYNPQKEKETYAHFDDEETDDKLVEQKMETSSEKLSGSDSDKVANGSINQSESFSLANGQNETNSFYYDRLSKSDQDIYCSILQSLSGCTKAELPASADDSIERVFKCVMNDHPEIFYVYGYTTTKEYLGDKLQRIYLEGTLNIESGELQSRKDKIENEISYILSRVENELDPYEMVKFFYEYIINHTEYDLHSVDNQNISSVFLNGRSVCQGYAKAFQYLLQKKGIESTLVQGTVNNGNAHAWNLIRIDGEYYYVDVTWGDASFNASTQQLIKQEETGPIYDYLCVTTSQICQTHQLDPIVTLPVCVAEKDNYYRREGFYFESVDVNQLQKVFDKAYEEDAKSVTIKCADAEVYREMCKYLLDQQNVFTFLRTSDGSVSYTNNDNMNIISFWL